MMKGLKVSKLKDYSDFWNKTLSRYDLLPLIIWSFGIRSHMALEEHVRQGGAESRTGMMWEGVASTPTALGFLPSSDLRILTLAK